MGKQRKYDGAAIFPMARSTGRVLIGLRSERVTHPLIWAPFAGHSKEHETYKQTALRELAEETGYDGPITVKRLANAPPNVFLGIVTDEFPPILNWESANAAWVAPHQAQVLTAAWRGLLQ